MVFKLPLSATQGFVTSLLQLLQLPLLAPDYSLLSKHQKTLTIKLPSKAKKNRPIHLVVDATDSYDCYINSIDIGAKPWFPPCKNAVRHKATD